MARNPFRSGNVPFSQIQATPASIPADNLTTSTLTLTYRYSDGTPIVGRTIRFRSSRGNTDVFSSPTAVTNAQGQASVTVRSGTVGVATFTCRDETAGIDLPASAQVSFTPVAQRRPIIDSVTTSRGVQGPFLQDVSVDNTITVRIADWNGQPGRVEFRLPDGRTRLGQLTGNTATLTLDMGRDLLYSPSGRWNEVQITAYNAAGVASETRTVHLMGLSLPPSLRRAHWLEVPTVQAAAEEISYNFKVRWSALDINAAAAQPLPIPFLFDVLWGYHLRFFPMSLHLRFQPLQYPSRNVQVESEIHVITQSTEYEFAQSVHVLGLKWHPKAEVAYELEYDPEFGLRSILSFVPGFASSIETPDLIHWAAKKCCLLGHWCCFLSLVDPFVDIVGRFGLGVDVPIVFWDSQQGFTFRRQINLVISPSGAAVIKIGRGTFLIEGEAGIEGFLHLQFPGRVDCYFGVPFLRQIGAEIRVSANVYLWQLIQELRLDQLLNKRFAYPNCRSGGYLGVLIWLQDMPKGEWREPERTYLYREPYHQVVAGMEFFPQDDNWDVREERLIQNVFPAASPALVWKDGRAIIAYAYDDPNLPAHQSTEIRALMQQPDGSWRDMPITQDTALDSQPTLAVDANGNIVAVWTRMENVSPEPDPNLRLPKGEIAYAVYNAQTGTWSAPTLLTQDDRLDLDPQLVQGADGQLYLVWLKSPDNVFPTDFTRPSLPHTDIYLARWDGAAFVEVRRAISRADTLEAALAVSSSGVPMLVWSRDADGNPDTGDTKLYYSYWHGSGWTTPQLVWSNPLPQSSPALAIGANDTPVLYFVRSELAHPEFEDHTQEELLVTSFTGSSWHEPLSVARADTLSELEVITHPNGRVSAIWLAASQGVADLWTAIYDPTVGYWSNKVRLTQDDMTHEQQVCAAWDPAGNPSAVYIKRQLRHEQREVEDDEGNRYPIQVTVPARADLYLLSHRPKPDLTIREGDLILEPSNPGPGQQVRIRARVSNLRALGARNVQVRFYDGDPDAGGTPIGTVRATPDPIVGGSFGTAELNWTVPTDGRSHVLYARVDPDNAIAETNETNNTASYPIAVLDLEAVAPVVEQYLPDGRVMLRFGVRNPSYVSPSGEVRWELRLNRADGAILTQGVANAPAAGQTSELHFAWNPNLSAGRYTLYLVIDPDNRFAEESETNNTASSEVALLADLAVNPALTNATRNGMQVELTATVQNLGWTDAQNVAVQVLDAPPGLGSVLASGTVASLPRYGSASLNLSFTLPRRIARLWVVVNPDGAIQEVRRDNNETILNLPWQAGDANGDDCVNNADLLAVIFAFGQSGSGLPEDVNGDGVVNNADLLEVLFNFGSGC
ncbi:MAG: CARDB domain-containing protein [Armatimonadota bacterium]